MIKPIAQTVLKVDMKLYPQWQFSSQWHSRSEVFWIIVDNYEDILHDETFLVTKEQVMKKQAIDISFFLPYRNSDIKEYSLMITSDTWIMEPQFDQIIDLREIQIQNERMDHTELLDLNPLPISALNNTEFEKVYRMKYFNPNQTQVFHALYHTDENVLIGSPTGSGKTIMSELAVLRVFT